MRTESAELSGDDSGGGIYCRKCRKWGEWGEAHGALRVYGGTGGQRVLGEAKRLVG